jgi:hypothetical protein
MATGCAVDESGNLKDAADIVFYGSETDTRPISNPAAAPIPSTGARGSFFFLFS